MTMKADMLRVCVGPVCGLRPAEWVKGGGACLRRLSSLSVIVTARRTYLAVVYSLCWASSSNLMEQEEQLWQQLLDLAAPSPQACHLLPNLTDMLQISY
jgi:hypothetical protein